MAPSHKLAILDDYVGIAPQYFSHIADLQVDSYPETLHPEQDEAQLAALAARLELYDIVSCMRERTPFRAALLARLPNLKLLTTTGMRNRGIDLAAAQDRGITVAGTTGQRDVRPADARAPTAPPSSLDYDVTTQQCFALLLALNARIPQHQRGIQEAGGWQHRLAVGLAGRTYGALGLGRLGSHAARVAVLGFGMRVLAWSQNLTQAGADEAAERMGLPQGSIAVAASKDDLLRAADVVSLHYILSERSRGLLGARELALMKSSALLVNSSRGPLVDEAALLDCLQRGAIRGAALDVFDLEPLPLDSPWRTVRWGEDGRSDVVLAPHMGYGVEELLYRWYTEQADTIEKYIRGEPLPDVMT